MRFQPWIRSLTAVGLLCGGAIAVASPSKIDDGALSKRIEGRIKADTYLKDEKIDIAVKSGVAKLKGQVPTNAIKARATKLARVKGVKAVDNRIEVEGAPKVSSDGAGELIEDSWITTKVKSKLANNALLEGSDISVETNGGVVKLTGTVPSDAVHARTLELVRGTKGVTQVDDLLVIAPKH